MSNNVGVSNSIGGALMSAEVGKVGEWSFDFELARKTVYLKVSLANENTVGLRQSSISNALVKDDINQLIQWLYAVKSSMEP
jgi:hypothetical protein